MRLLIRAILSLLFRTRLIGAERFRFDGASIIMPNHVSFLDAVFLYAYLPQTVCFVINTQIAATLPAFILNRVKHLEVDPFNPYSLKKIVGVIKTGRPIVLFPEGRITTTGSLMKIYSGVGFIALKTGALVQPVIFRGLERSKVSRLQDKIRTQWFPQVTLYVGAQEQLSADTGKRFRQQKRDISDKILVMLQNAMFQARQAEDVYQNLFDKLLAAGRIYGMGTKAVEDIGGTVTYRQAILGSYVLGEKLRPVIGEEARVGVLLPNSIGHLVTLFALFYLGKTPAILNFSAGVDNNRDCAETAGLKIILTSRVFIDKGNFQDLAARLAQTHRLIFLEDIKAQISIKDKLSGAARYLIRATAAGEASIILFTSGSESKPKGVVLRHANILANLNQISSVIAYTSRDKMLNALPMFHSFGLTAGTLLPVLYGFEVFLYPSPLHFKVIPELSYDRNVTLLLGTSTFLNGYGRNAHPYDFYNMRLVIAGGEKLKEEVKKLWQDKFGLRIFEGYGTTETAPVLSLNTPLFIKTGTVGRLLPGIEYRLEEVPGLAEGRNLLVKGANVMEGYLLHSKGFVPAPEWYASGDVVVIDQEGFVSIRSRLKRFAKISGEMVSLDAVEKMAEKCFGSEGNAAINLPDPKKGERIVLYTCCKEASKQLLREFISQTGQSLLSMPSEVVVVDKLPLLGSGKTDYVTLKSWKVSGGEENA